MTNSRSHQVPVQLPACGLFVGSGIMNSVPDYLVCSGRTHTTWVPQLFTPLELLDKIIEDSQGNLVQNWGLNRGIVAVRIPESSTPVSASLI